MYVRVVTVSMSAMWECAYWSLETQSNHSPSPGNPGLQLGSVQSGLMDKSDWTKPQTGSIGVDGLRLDRSIYTYNFVIAF
jgi:hypothetical protein